MDNKLNVYDTEDSLWGCRAVLCHIAELWFSTGTFLPDNLLVAVFYHERSVKATRVPAQQSNSAELRVKPVKMLRSFLGK